MTFTSTDPPAHEGKTNTWFTPKYIVEALGPFDLDPCTQSFRPFNTALNHYCEDEGQCGLSLPWHGRVWLNPPYGKSMHLWLDKFNQHKNGVALVFARMGNEAIQKCVTNGAGFYFLRNRIKFLDREGKMARSNAGADSCLIHYGELIFKRELMGVSIGIKRKNEGNGNGK